MKGAVAITGLGLVTPLGVTPWSTFAALLDGRTTADRLDEIDETIDATTLAQATGGCGRARFSPVDPAIEIAERAARDALFEAFPEGAPEPVRTIVASSKGAVVALINALSRAPHEHHEPAALGPHGWLCDQLRRRLNLGATTSVVAACATAAAALHQARMEIVSGEHETVLVVAVEAALHPIFVESYRRLGVLAPIDPPALHRARPLDAERCGFTLNETGAAVVLQREGVHPRPQAALTGSALAAQAEDIVRPTGGFRVLQRLIREVAAGPIAAVHPHAPGTDANDAAELAAIGEVLDAGAPAYALKGAIGHSLGASALVSSVIAVIAGRAGRLPPMPWIRKPVDGLPVSPGGTAIEGGEHLVLAAGFGGHVGALTISVR